MLQADDAIVETLKLARDLCMGTAAFAVSREGSVRYEIFPSEAHSDVGSRIETLARSSLTRPGAQGNEAFWNAEILGESESADESLACVAVPVHAGGQWFGLLGVVDTWLPELDEEQRVGLLRLSQALGAQLSALGSSPQGPQWRTPSDSAEPDGPPTIIPPGSSVPPAEPELSPPGSLIARQSVSSALGEPDSRSERLLDPRTETPPGEALLAEIAQNLPEGLVVAREDGTIIFANETMEELSNRSSEDILGSDVRALLHGIEPAADVPAELSAADLLSTPPPGQLLKLGTDDMGIAVEASGARFESALAGECYVGLLRHARRDTSDQGRLAQEAGLSGEDSGVIANLLDALEEGIVVCDGSGTVVLANKAAKTLQGLPEDEPLEGNPFLIAPSLCTSDGSPLTRAHHPLIRALHGTVVRSEQLQLAGNEAEKRHIVASAKPFELEQETGALLVLRDVTSQLEEEAWLMHLALHDPLTGLANRYLLLDYLRRVLLQFRTRGGSIALVFLDLDDFKMINDRFGHDVGDEVLVAVGRRIQGAVRSSDIVARLGGDEFVVAHAASDDPGEIDLVVSRIRKTLTAPYQVRGQTLAVSASIGWVAADPRHEDPTTLLVRADREMYRRKSARNRAREASS